VSESLESLTRRELQVAAFVADGLTDREVGEKLSITRRTAEWHVVQILAKLNLRSRSQIASRVAQAEALGAPLLAAEPRRNLRPQQTAVIGFNAAASETHELLTTTRYLADRLIETDSELQERLSSLAEAGYDPVIATGVNYVVAMSKVAKLYPSTQFAIVDDASLSAEYKNVTSLVLADHQGSYLVGAIAAHASKTGTIGFIGGVNIPSIRKFQAGYAAGAKAVKPSITIQFNFLTQPPDLTGFGDRERGRVAATGMYRGGADVIYAAAGPAGFGVFEAAVEASSLAIGVDVDQYLTAPVNVRGCVLTSMLKHVDQAVHKYVKAYLAGSPLPRVMTFDLASGEVGYSKSNPMVFPYVAVVEDLKSQIVEGIIRVPDKP
jgi:basic membrane protein A and related proteins